MMMFVHEKTLLMQMRSVVLMSSSRASHRREAAPPGPCPLPGMLMTRTVLHSGSVRERRSLQEPCPLTRLLTCTVYLGLDVRMRHILQEPCSPLVMLTTTVLHNLVREMWELFLTDPIILATRTTYGWAGIHASTHWVALTRSSAIVDVVFPDPQVIPSWPFLNLWSSWNWLNTTHLVVLWCLLCLLTQLRQLLLTRVGLVLGPGKAALMIATPPGVGHHFGRIPLSPGSVCVLLPPDLLLISRFGWVTGILWSWGFWVAAGMAGCLLALEMANTEVLILHLVAGRGWDPGLVPLPTQTWQPSGLPSRHKAAGRAIDLGHHWL